MPWIASLAETRAKETDVAKLVRLKLQDKLEASRKELDEAAEAARAEAVVAVATAKDAAERQAEEEFRYRQRLRKLHKDNDTRRSQRQLSGGALAPVSSSLVNRS